MLFSTALAALVSLSLARPSPENNPSSSSSTLYPRAHPDDQHCEDPAHWEGRYCDGDTGPGAWVDQCGRNEGEAYFPLYFCPEGQTCFEFLDGDGDAHIDCVDLKKELADKDDEVLSTLQLGKRKFDGKPVSHDPAKKPRIVSINVMNEYLFASVSAVIMDDNLGFDIHTSEILTANRRGFQDIRCKEDGYTSKKKGQRQCTPGGRETLKKSWWLDFTFTTLENQSGWLVYFIRATSYRNGPPTARGFNESDWIPARNAMVETVETLD